jgi:hypothetical protein
LEDDHSPFLQREGRRFNDRRRPVGTKTGGFRNRNAQNRPGNQLKVRGGLANGARNAVAAPKRQRTLVIGNKEDAKPQKVLRPSAVRLKVRNIDEKQVTNDDLKKLF